MVMMKAKRKYLYIISVGILLISMLEIWKILPGERWAQADERNASRTMLSSRFPPFMHRPYYGSRTMRQRTVSFFDHDKPWYVNDGMFVRYDGAKWQNVGVGACVGGMNCYDGHNGYDLSMWFEPVLSAAAGTVTRAQWYNPLNHNAAYGLWVAIDHGNGFTTAYGHLSDVTVSVGDHVSTQWQIGTSGTTGASMGPHLHLATYYLPAWQPTDPFGWSGRYPDPNAVRDNYLWVSNPGTPNTLPNLSSTGRANYPGAVVVDDSGAGWSSTGTWNSVTRMSGINGTAHWTTTTTGNATATATWRPKLPADGYYEVGAFVDDIHASSSWVPYTIYSADPTHKGATIKHNIYADESHIGVFAGAFGRVSTGPQWISLGTYYFRHANGGSVVVSNATGEAGCQIAADGVEFVPIH
jgi:murein DD-endopeptidase MepM/ murein hydrolase activator NlpD